jgi:hypothetical protein
LKERRRGGALLRRDLRSERVRFLRERFELELG